jgi:hypothetical protein
MSGRIRHGPVPPARKRGPRQAANHFAAVVRKASPVLQKWERQVLSVNSVL